MRLFLMTALFWAATPQLMANPSQPPRELGIAAVSHRGTGCPEGSVASNVAPDGQALTLIFSQFGVDTSVRAGLPMRKACHVELTMRHVPGWQYSLVGVDVRGYASLEAGAVGVQKVAYWFGQKTKRAVDRLRLVGPYDGNFANYTDIGSSDGEWSPCDRRTALSRLVLRVAINIRPQRGFTDEDGDLDSGRRGVSYPSGYMAVDSLDGGIVHRYKVAYRACR